MNLYTSSWPVKKLIDICSPKQWSTISSAQLTKSGYPVYGANGIIGYYSQYNHEEPTILITCRGATCGAVNVSVGKAYVTGNAMALDNLDTRSVDQRYLSRYLQRPGVLDRAITGSAQPQITGKSLSSIQIVLPPLNEQCRIAAVLDKVDTLRELRRRAIALLDELVLSIFHSMFGNPEQHQDGRTQTEFASVTQYTRNGVSPSKSGANVAKVLTLSAITGDRFRIECRKEGTFHESIPNSKTVDEDDFLICRGNGNIDLVGKGYFPTESQNDVAFPDTVIAAKIDKDKVAPGYIEEVWKTSAIRSQIKRLARTTNGTYKINQKSLDSIVITCPPLKEQKRFEERALALRVVRESNETHLAKLDALFASIQARAFAGELWETGVDLVRAFGKARLVSSNFGFLEGFRPDWRREASQAEQYGLTDPRAACFYARHTLELLVNWLFDAEPALVPPYRRELGAKLGAPTFNQVMPHEVWQKMDLIVRVGNRAVHRPGPVHSRDSMKVVEELWHVMYWAARIYGPEGTKLAATSLTFDAGLIERPRSDGERRHRQPELKAMLDENLRRDTKLADQRLHDADVNAAYQREVAKLQKEIAEAKAANQAIPDSHNYNEAETRTHLIDEQLLEAGWVAGENLELEVPVSELESTKSGQGKVDYVLCGANGKPVGLLEVKRTRKDPLTGQAQAAEYADALERQFGQRPIIFCSNGYHTWIWDDVMYPPRRVAGIYTQTQLESVIQRRAGRKRLTRTPINPEVANRRYQKLVISAVDETFDESSDGKPMRRALLVMATGTGKTRVAIAVVDQMMRAGWIKRALFLADRQALVTQATNAFKTYLPNVATVNLLADKNAEGRVFVSTYPTMMGLINQRDADAQRRFSPGYFDLVIIDEAHRSIYQKYSTLLDYFDALQLGLTATPKDEIDRNTYRRFELEDGLPTYVYDIEEAVAENWLVPPRAVKVPVTMPTRGKRYADLSDEEKQDWDEREWNSDGIVPDRIEPDEVNKYVFNDDTVDEVLRVLMTEGITVDGGDRIGKTIIFARNQRHAQHIADRFNVNYPQYRGKFAQVISHDVSRAQQLILDFGVPDKNPHIAISVDMLDTGVDIPEVVNLVLFKPVYSKTKFWQMLGRGTRLCKDLFGANQDKQEFKVFDVYDNLEFFQHEMPASEGKLAPTVNEQIFTHRAELIYRLDQERRTDER